MAEASGSHLRRIIFQSSNARMCCVDALSAPTSRMSSVNCSPSCSTIRASLCGGFVSRRRYRASQRRTTRKQENKKPDARPDARRRVKGCEGTVVVMANRCRK
eukprot:1764694-Rhodomonas_salina.1